MRFSACTGCKVPVFTDGEQTAYLMSYPRIRGFSCDEIFRPFVHFADFDFDLAKPDRGVILDKAYLSPRGMAHRVLG